LTISPEARAGAWHERQQKEKDDWDGIWTDTGLVFTREDGTAWHPDRISKVFE
jgi:hypothetical protein